MKPPLLFIVAWKRPDLWDYLRRWFAEVGEVQVLLDRPRGERGAPGARPAVRGGGPWGDWCGERERRRDRDRGVRAGDGNPGCGGCTAVEVRRRLVLGRCGGGSQGGRRAPLAG